MPPAIVPPAPGRFSTMNCWPRASDSPSARMRVATSVPPPAPNPIKTWTGFDGQSCANAEGAAAVKNTAIAATIQVRFTIALPCRRTSPRGASDMTIQGTRSVTALSTGTALLFVLDWVAQYAHAFDLDLACIAG